MTIVIRRRGLPGDFTGEIARLESLVSDLRHLADGNLPTPKNIADAPLIDGWVQATRPELCLVGQMHGHPVCRGPLSITSGLWVWAPEHGWVRTLSRFYRLGRPHDAGRPQ
jgi:hypothetical protein